MSFKRSMGEGPKDWADVPEAILAAAFGRGRGGRRNAGNWSFDWDPEAFVFGFGDKGRGRGRGGPRGPGGPGGRRRRRLLDSGELRFVLLRLIADEARHGYDLIRAIEDMTHGEYAPSPGVIYPTLSLLEDSGLIEQEESEGSRKIFKITEEGEAELADNAEDIEEIFERLGEVGEAKRERQEQTGGSVGRAIGNLMAALGNRVARGDSDTETRHKIAAILDEAAQKIERL